MNAGGEIVSEIIPSDNVDTLRSELERAGKFVLLIKEQNRIEESFKSFNII